MEIYHTPNLHEGTVSQKRAEILAYFHHSFDTYESLFGNLKNDEAFYQRPEKLRSSQINFKISNFLTSFNTCLQETKFPLCLLVYSIKSKFNTGGTHMGVP